MCAFIFKASSILDNSVPPLTPTLNILQDTNDDFIHWRKVAGIHHAVFHLCTESAIWFTSAVRRQWEAIKAVINAGVLEEQRCVIVVEREMIT